MVGVLMWMGLVKTMMRGCNIGRWVGRCKRGVNGMEAPPPPHPPCSSSRTGQEDALVAAARLGVVQLQVRLALVCVGMDTCRVRGQMKWARARWGGDGGGKKKSQLVSDREIER